MNSFDIVKAKVKVEEHYKRRNYELMGKVWTIDTWKKDDVAFQDVEFGYAEVIIVPSILEVIRKYDNSLKFRVGNINILEAIALKL